MKGFALILLVLFSTASFAAPECSTEAQGKIDSILSQISTETNRMKVLDLEFEIKKVSYNYENCRTKPAQILEMPTYEGESLASL